MDCWAKTRKQAAKGLADVRVEVKFCKGKKENMEISDKNKVLYCKDVYLSNSPFDE